MNIAIIAHDSKKELMIQFCAAYSGILSQHYLCSTSITGKMVGEATGLSIYKHLSCQQGGDQQISARIACGEIDILIFFRDINNPSENQRSENNLLRICDVHNIPCATNIATAEALIHALHRGDLDWLKVTKNRI